MSVSRQFAVLAIALSLATSGCSWFKRRKPSPVPQAQAPAPAQQPAEPPPAPATQTPPTQEEKPAETAETKPKPKPKPARPVKKVVVPATKPEEEQPATTASNTAPPRVSIQEGTPGTTNQISSAMPHDQATDSKRTTQQ